MVPKNVRPASGARAATVNHDVFADWLLAAQRFPNTRYQGSKRKLAVSIVSHTLELPFTTVLDAFGGTGAVAYAFKCAGKRVVYNDALAFNHQIGTALIENTSIALSEVEIESIGRRQPGVTYGDVIERTFDGIYFTREENQWLDVAVGNIRLIECRFKRASAWFAVFQAAIAKRPYNLFHRRNLYMRLADVSRGFGNKTSWDRSFPDHVRRFAAAAATACFDNGQSCRAICGDALAVPGSYELVYIDTPYINRKGVGVDYRDFYHFLEGMLRYDDWPEMIDRKSKHRRLVRANDPWSDPDACREAFRRLFAKFRKSIIVVSYRSDGIPAVDELVFMLRDLKREVRRIDGDAYQYALSTNRNAREVLLIASD